MKMNIFTHTHKHTVGFRDQNRFWEIKPDVTEIVEAKLNKNVESHSIFPKRYIQQQERKERTREREVLASLQKVI